MFFYVNSIFITTLLTQLISPAIIHFIFAAQVYFPLAYSYTRFNSGIYGAPPRFRSILAADASRP